MSAGGIVLVTGVGHGFGRAVALGWGRAGFDVVCADRDVEMAARTAAEVEEVGGQAIPIQTDVTLAMDVRDAFSKVDELFGELEGVVHVASRVSAGDPRTLADAEFHELVADTLLSSHLVLRTAARVLERGWVVVIGPPTSTQRPHDRMVRAGLEGLVSGYDSETGPRANLVLPSRPAADPAHDARVVRTALFLGSEDAAGIRGTSVHVDLPPPPRVVERLLPEIQAALDDRVRQDDLEAAADRDLDDGLEADLDELYRLDADQDAGPDDEADEEADDEPPEWGPEAGDLRRGW